MVVSPAVCGGAVAFLRYLRRFRAMGQKSGRFAQVFGGSLQKRPHFTAFRGPFWGPPPEKLVTPATWPAGAGKGPFLSAAIWGSRPQKAPGQAGPENGRFYYRPYGETSPKKPRSRLGQKTAVFISGHIGKQAPPGWARKRPFLSAAIWGNKPQEAPGQAGPRNGRFYQRPYRKTGPARRGQKNSRFY